MRSNAPPPWPAWATSPGDRAYFRVSKVTKVCPERRRAADRGTGGGHHDRGQQRRASPNTAASPIPRRGQKLIVDEAITPPKCIFDYAVTASQPTLNLTQDGSLDDIAATWRSTTGPPARRAGARGLRGDPGPGHPGLTEVMANPRDPRRG